jgi:hypothetical protein
MPYVMVPVPEEHVVDVMQYVTRLVARGSREPWDQESVEEVFTAADEPVRSLLSVVASAALADRAITGSDAIQSIELKRRDLVELIAAIDEMAKERNRRPLFVMEKAEQEAPGGRMRPVRHLVMERDVAEMIRAVELKIRELEPHPLDRDVG